MTVFRPINKPRGASDMDKREIDLDYTEMSSFDKSILIDE
jgi:hypothetical protein